MSDASNSESRLAHLEAGYGAIKSDLAYLVRRFDELSVFMQNLTRMEERHTSHAESLKRAHSRLDVVEGEFTTHEKETAKTHNEINREINSVRSAHEKWVNRALGAWASASVVWALFGGAVIWWVGYVTNVPK